MGVQIPSSVNLINKNKSGCGVIGSVFVLGTKGYEFKSHHPDLLFLLWGYSLFGRIHVLHTCGIGSIPVNSIKFITIIINLYMST